MEGYARALSSALTKELDDLVKQATLRSFDVLGSFIVTSYLLRPACTTKSARHRRWEVIATGKIDGDRQGHEAIGVARSRRLAHRLGRQQIGTLLVSFNAMPVCPVHHIQFEVVISSDSSNPTPSQPIQPEVSP
jgi:hypothetical protein